MAREVKEREREREGEQGMGATNQSTDNESSEKGREGGITRRERKREREGQTAIWPTVVVVVCG